MDNEVICKWIATDTFRLDELTPFQGNLKKRTQADIDKLKESLLREGLIMPFAVWKHDDKNYILDGHGRYEALKQIEGDGEHVAYPCVIIQADTEDDARKALLQITSQYGKITKAGVKQFTASIPTYIAPSIQKFVTTGTSKLKPVKPVLHAESDKRIIKIQVAAADYDAVVKILSESPYVKII